MAESKKPDSTQDPKETTRPVPGAARTIQIRTNPADSTRPMTTPAARPTPPLSPKLTKDTPKATPALRSAPAAGRTAIIRRTGATPALQGPGGTQALKRTGPVPAVKRTGAVPALRSTGTTSAIRRTGSVPRVDGPYAQPDQAVAEQLRARRRDIERKKRRAAIERLRMQAELSEGWQRIWKTVGITVLILACAFGYFQMQQLYHDRWPLLAVWIMMSMAILGGFGWILWYMNRGDI